MDFICIWGVGFGLENLQIPYIVLDMVWYNMIKNSKVVNNILINHDRRWNEWQHLRLVSSLQ